MENKQFREVTDYLKKVHGVSFKELADILNESVSNIYNIVRCYITYSQIIDQQHEIKMKKAQLSLWLL